MLRMKIMKMMTTTTIRGKIILIMITVLTIKSTLNKYIYYDNNIYNTCIYM